MQLYHKTLSIDSEIMHNLRGLLLSNISEELRVFLYEMNVSLCEPEYNMKLI